MRVQLRNLREFREVLIGLIKRRCAVIVNEDMSLTLLGTY